MNERRTSKRRTLFVVLVFSVLAGIGFLIPGSPAYLPSLLRHYSQYQNGHSLGYWLRALQRPDADVRQHAVVALGAIGPDAAEAVPTLATILTNDADGNTRFQAALALGKMAPASGAAVPALARALEEDKTPLVRMNAAIALCRLGIQARPAMPTLIKALQHRANRTNLGTFPYTIQEIAAVALGRATAGTSDGVKPLLKTLETARTATKRRLLAQALGEIGEPARSAEPQLRALLADDNLEVRDAAKEGLRKIRGG